MIKINKELVVMVELKKKVESKIYKYLPEVRNRWKKVKREEGWYNVYTLPFECEKKISVDDILNDEYCYMIDGNKAYSKPRIIISLADSTKQVKVFESDDEAIDYINENYPNFIEL